MSVAEKYKNATDEFLEVVKALKDSDLDKSDKEGWTPRQVIHHMADSEAQSYARLRKLIAEPGSIIQGYDEGKWAENKTLGYATEDVQTSIEVIKAVRQSSYELLNRITEAQINNSGIHSESGNYSVNDWLKTYIKHPIDHANQIRNQLK
jgi:hypothetical protein